MPDVSSTNVRFSTRISNRLTRLESFEPNSNCWCGDYSSVWHTCYFFWTVMTHDPVSAYPDRILQSPSAEHWFGTDSNGMDVFSRVIYGAKFGFGIAIPAVTISVLIGVPVGLIAGYRGGILDEVLMRIFDGLRVFPSIILALAVVAATGQSLINVVLVLGFWYSPVFARLVRAEVLTLRSSIFVESAVVAGKKILFSR